MPGHGLLTFADARVRILVNVDDERPSTGELLTQWRDATRAAELAERLAEIASQAADQADRSALASDQIARMAEKAAVAAERAARSARKAARQAADSPSRTVSNACPSRTRRS